MLGCCFWCYVLEEPTSRPLRDEMRWSSGGGRWNDSAGAEVKRRYPGRIGGQKGQEPKSTCSWMLVGELQEALQVVRDLEGCPPHIPQGQMLWMYGEQQKSMQLFVNTALLAVKIFNISISFSTTGQFTWTETEVSPHDTWNAESDLRSYNCTWMGGLRFSRSCYMLVNTLKHVLEAKVVIQKLDHWILMRLKMNHEKLFNKRKIIVTKIVRNRPHLNLFV